MKIYYLIGQPGSGKTTLGNLLCNFLGMGAVHIDGDEIRLMFDDKDYSKNGRIKNIQRAHNIARILTKKYYSVVISLVSPYIELREDFKNKNDVVEIFLHTTENRDKNQFHVENYEAPIKNFIDIDTTNKTIKESFEEILKQI